MEVWKRTDPTGRRVLVWIPAPLALVNCVILVLLLKLILSFSLSFEQLEERSYPCRSKYSVWYLIIKVFWTNKSFDMVLESKRL